MNVCGEARGEKLLLCLRFVYILCVVGSEEVPHVFSFLSLSLCVGKPPTLFIFNNKKNIRVPIANCNSIPTYSVNIVVFFFLST